MREGAPAVVRRAEQPRGEPHSDQRRLRQARVALLGTSVGDAFGQRFFGADLQALARVAAREVPPGPWPWTDDTALAICVFDVLRTLGRIDQDRLARSFGETYRGDPFRGYGAGMHSLLEDYVEGAEWRTLSGRQFGGAGSYGNGASMRVAALGAYFADDLERAVAEAGASAVVTHTHPEGVVGAIAVAVAAALTVEARDLDGSAFIEAVCRRLPSSEVREQASQAARFGGDALVEDVVAVVGNGSFVSAQDTVPFALWTAAHHLSDFERALWTTVSGLGDRDTTCAIVGGIVAGRVGERGIPHEWIARREPLPPWVEEPP